MDSKLFLMLLFTVIAIIVVLSFQVIPAALGFDPKKGLNQTIWFALILILGQFILFLIGFILGQRFMHLMDDFKGTVLFIGFFLIGIRMIMEAFKVRKGERTFTFESTKSVILASLALGINTFLAGLLFTNLPFERQTLTMILTSATMVFVGIGTVMKPGKTGFTMSSLLFLAGGLWMIFSSLYLGFFI